MQWFQAAPQSQNFDEWDSKKRDAMIVKEHT